jgi:hypothetical protein
MEEKTLMFNLEEATLEWENAKRVLSEAKKKLVTAENAVINSKINRDRTVEALRMHRATTQQFDLVAHERNEEIADFKSRFPELCGMAHDRDVSK